MSRIDLHMHSIYSDDGQYSPARLMEICLESGVRTAAIADHNSVRGINEAKKAAFINGVTLIPAVELDCFYNGVNLHVLGYWIDADKPVFAEIEKDIIRQEAHAGKERVRLIEELGIQLDHGLIEKLSASTQGIVTGELIGEAALENPGNLKNPMLLPYREGGARSDNPLVNFYWDFCAQGKPAYSEIVYISLEETVQVIKETGGVPVLAHPGNNIQDNPSLLKQIAGTGIKGVEAFSSYHNREQVLFYKEQAADLGLFLTCGSDFHGKTKPAIKAGSIDCDGLEGTILESLWQ